MVELEGGEVPTAYFLLDSMSLRFLTLSTLYRRPPGVESCGKFASPCPRVLLPINPATQIPLIGEPVSCTAEPEPPARGQLMFKEDASLAAAFPVFQIDDL